MSCLATFGAVVIEVTVSWPAASRAPPPAPAHPADEPEVKSSPQKIDEPSREGGKSDPEIKRRIRQVLSNSFGNHRRHVRHPTLRSDTFCRLAFWILKSFWIGLCTRRANTALPGALRLLLRARCARTLYCRGALPAPLPRHDAITCSTQQSCTTSLSQKNAVPAFPMRKPCACA